MSEETDWWNGARGYASASKLHETGSQDFFRPPLDAYDPVVYEGPSNTNEIVQAICKQRLIILGGEHVSDKHASARHFAWLVRNELTTQVDGVSVQLPVYEWKRTGSKFVDHAVEMQDTQAIFILPDLLPQHISYSLLRLTQIAAERHIVIVTIESKSLWQKAMSVTLHIHSFDNAYRDLKQQHTRETLRHILLSTLKDNCDSLPQWLRANIVVSDEHVNAPLIGALRADAIAVQLETQENIIYFVRLLRNKATEDQIATEAAVQTYIEDIRSYRYRIGEWFRALDKRPREQLLVLALSFFDGLADDQFFAAFETLIDEVWHRRDPSLRALDYQDFNPLDKFFNYVPLKVGGEGVKMHYPDQRRLVMQIAWGSHRRHIVNALPVFYNLIKASVANDVNHWALFGTTGRREQLRKTLSETISDIGLQQVIAVEELLLHLAVDTNMGVQAVAARAVARWREYNESLSTFELLQRWMFDEDVQRTAIALVDGKDEAKRGAAKTSLKCTIALAIGYAAQSDQPNQMHEMLYKLFKSLSLDNDIRVQTMLATVTLPMVIALHVVQMRDIILNLTRGEDLHGPIAKSMVQVYRQQPTEVLRIVEGWFRWCFKDQTRRAKGRTSLLACVARIYGELPYDEQQTYGSSLHSEQPKQMTIPSAFQRLRQILNEETETIIRKQALRAAIKLSREHFTKLQDIVPVVTTEELVEIVDQLVEIYVEQRAALKNYLPLWYHRGTKQSYAVWPDGQRPLTAIENEMLNWLQNDRNSVSQQIGVRALANFARTIDIPERHYLEQQYRGRHRRQRKRSDTEPRQETSRRKFTGLYDERFYHAFIIPWLVTIGRERYRPIIRGLLPEVLQLHMASRATIEFLLSDWMIITDDDIPKLAWRLQRSIFWNSLLGRWILGGVVVTLALLTMLPLLVTTPLLWPIWQFIAIVYILMWSVGWLLIWVRQ